MNIVIITQDDPFYLAKNIDYLIENLPKGAKVVGCVVFDVSPFGKRESFTDKIKRTHQIFGTGFLIRYGIKFVLNKLDSSTKVDKVLNKHNSGTARTRTFIQFSLFVIRLCYSACSPARGRLTSIHT